MNLESISKPYSVRANNLVKHKMKPYHSNYWKWKDKEYRFDIYISDTFENLQNVKQVYVIVLSKDQKSVLVVHGKSGMWMLPGGGVEDGESMLDTLVREVKEETNRDIDISTAKPMFYQEACKKNDSGEWEFTRTEVRYSVVVENDNEFISDPDNGDVIEARWVKITDLEKYLDWGKTVDLIKDLLQK